MPYPLHEAAREGNISKIRSLLNRKIPLLKKHTLADRDAEGNTVLLIAAKHGQFDTVQWLAEQQCPLDEKNDAKEGVLFFLGQAEFYQDSFYQKKLGTFQYLTNNTQKFSFKNNVGFQPLDYSEALFAQASKSSLRNRRVLQWMVNEWVINKKFFLANQTNDKGETILGKIFSGAEYWPKEQEIWRDPEFLINIAQQLIDHGANINALDKKNTNTLDEFVMKAGSLNYQNSKDRVLISKFFNYIFKQSGWDINNKFLKDKKSALHIAVWLGDLALAEWLVDEKKQSIEDESAEQGNTPLILAKWVGRIDMVEWLIGKGADINHRNKDGLDARSAGSVVNGEAIIRLIDRTLEARRIQALAAANGITIQPTIGNNNNNATPQLNNLVNNLGQISLSLEISYNELVVGLKLGQGAFGDVYQAEWRHSDVAVKQLKANNFSDEALTEFKHEASVMAQLRTPHIIQLYGICITQPYCLVMEYAPGGSLYALLHSDKEINWPKRLQIAVDIGKGLSFLHTREQAILHRDLKSMNVLLDKNQDPKLTDFGLAKIKSDSTSKVTGGAAGTPAWMAPELFEDNPHHTAECDIYSYAIVLWELATRQDPFKGSNVAQIALKITQGKRPDFPESEDTHVKQYRDTVLKAWSQDPMSRTKLDDIIKELETPNTTPQSIGFLDASSQTVLKKKQ